MTDLKKLEWMRRGQIAGWIAFFVLGFVHIAANTKIVNEFARGQLSWMIGVVSGLLFGYLLTVGDKVKAAREAVEKQLSS